MPFVRYKKRKPKIDGEYLCRFFGDEQHVVKGCGYLEFRDGYFEVEHDDYYNIEWFEESEQVISPNNANEMWVCLGEICKEFERNKLSKGTISEAKEIYQKLSKYFQ